MGFLARVLLVAISLGAAVLIQNYRQLAKPIPIPQLDVNQYWGPGSVSNYKENSAIKPFDISTKPEVIDVLKEQLSRPLKLQDPLEGIGFEYGFNSKYLTKIIKYWSESYLPKWSERETFLKKFPHFQTQIQGLNVHFLHVKPESTKGKKVLPLLLLHGWPGSIREFYEIIPLLTTPNKNSEYVFEIVVPSLVGYGWSQGAAKPNFGPIQMSVVFRNLMVRLGYEKFVIQGGDWGSIVGSSLATLFPNNVLGYHSNMCGAQTPISQIKMLVIRLFSKFFVKEEYAEFYKPLSETFSHLLTESGYMHLQSTKPDTIGIALAHNPVGLAAYILEKFSTWTNVNFRKLPDGGLTERYTLDALLDNIMIYYLTNSITTSQRLYAEAFSKRSFALQIDRAQVKVPSGCARFQHDLIHSTDCELKEKFINLVHSTHHKDGGHFIAMELPQVLYEDFIQYVKVAFKDIHN